MWLTFKTMREVREEFSQMRDDLTGLAYQFEHLSERERLEREKLVLAMENALLRMERRLPPAKTGNEK